MVLSTSTRTGFRFGIPPGVSHFRGVDRARPAVAHDLAAPPDQILKNLPRTPFVARAHSAADCLAITMRTEDDDTWHLRQVLRSAP
jgi:hypothetical protein